MRTRPAARAVLCALLLCAPASAIADDPPAPPPDSPPAPSCLPAKGSTDDAGIRGIRVGVPASVRDPDGKPVEAGSVSYCVEGGGNLSFALARESDVVLVVSTAQGDSIGQVSPTERAESARSEFPRMRKLVRAGSTTVYRVDPRRQLILGVAAGRVAYIAAADRLLLEYPGKLGYYLHRLGV